MHAAGWRSIMASLRMRLLVGALVVMLLALALVGWGLQTLFERHITAQLHMQLELHVHQLSAAVQRQADGQVLVAPLQSSPRLDEPFSGLYWQVEQPLDNGIYQPLARSRSLWDAVLQVPAAAWQLPPNDSGVIYTQWVDSTGQTLLAAMRLLQLSQQGPVLHLTVAAEHTLLAEPLADFSTMLWLTLGALALGLFAAVVVQLQLALRPLQQLRLGLEAVRTGQTAQLQGDYPQELQPLVHAFNHVLQANSDMVERARAQAGNLAHAVHTPLAIMANAAYAHAGPLAQLVQEQVQTARQQVDYHLARARATAAVRATGVATPLQAPLQALVRTMQQLHAERGLQWHVGVVEAQWAFRGEQQDLYEILGNVLDNAGKWASTQVQVEVMQSGSNEMLHVVVDDDGPGIPEAERARMLQRGQRLDEQRPGSGLGLDIVRALVESYGGHIALQASPLGGLRVMLALPQLQERVGG